MSSAILLSNWYSGATLTSILLDAHPEIICNGETFPFAETDMRRHLCSCGEYIDQCEFFKKTLEIDEGKNFPENWNYKRYVVNPLFSKNKYLNKFLASPVRDSNLRRWFEKRSKVNQKISIFYDAQVNFMEKAKEFSGAKIYLDGTKSIRRAQIFAKYSKNQNIKLIHLVRDGRAFCNSYRKNKKIDEGKIEIAAKEWNEYISLVEKLKLNYSNLDIIDVRYEDLCRNFKSTYKYIEQFLGVCQIDHSHLEKDKSHILGNRMRKDFDFSIKEDISWKNELSEETIKNISEKMKSNLIKYNYI